MWRPHRTRLRRLSLSWKVIRSVICFSDVGIRDGRNGNDPSPNILDKLVDENCIKATVFGV